VKPITVDEPWEMISIDITGPLTKTADGNIYIIVAIDHFSKFVEAKALTNFTAETTARFVYEQIICRYGTPQRILTDQGRNFEAKLFKEMCSLCGIDKIRTTAYHPETNGLVERMNKTLKQMLIMFVNEHHSDWDVFLHQVISAYNSTFQSSTKFSPHQVLFGCKIKSMPDRLTSSHSTDKQKPKSIDDYVSQIERARNKLSRIVKNNIVKAKEKQRDYYNK
jgi:hypothetical protein